MWVVPGATQRYIRNKSHGVRDKTLGLIVHVQDGNGELTGWYNNPGSEASSAWQVMKTGRIFQFGDPDADKFWTQAAGNPDYGAAEGEGKPSEPMTPEQIEGFAQIYAKGHAEEGWPFQLAHQPGDRGLGWHGMGGAAWGGHYNCPGDLRRAQLPLILARARQIAGAPPVQEDDMPTVKDLLDAPLGTNPADPKKTVDLGTSVAIARNYSYYTWQLVRSLAAKSGIDVDEKALAAEILATLAPTLRDAVSKAATAGGSPEQIADAVVAALGTKLAGKEA